MPTKRRIRAYTNIKTRISLMWRTQQMGHKMQLKQNTKEQNKILMIKRYHVLEIFDSDCLSMMFTENSYWTLKISKAFFNAFPEKSKSPCKVSSTRFGLMFPQWREWSTSFRTGVFLEVKMLLTSKGKKWVSQRGRAQTPALTAPRNTTVGWVIQLCE